MRFMAVVIRAMCVEQQQVAWHMRSLVLMCGATRAVSGIQSINHSVIMRPHVYLLRSVNAWLELAHVPLNWLLTS
jgi:hypothetical protein